MRYSVHLEFGKDEAVLAVSCRVLFGSDEQLVVRMAEYGL
jgi:hypothetical protein